jgi:histidine triad (HIT) family protein
MLEDAGSIPASSTFAHGSRWLRRTSCVLATGSVLVGPSAVANAYGDRMEAGCVFCSIVAGETPAEVVLDEPDFVAFLDGRPVFKGHSLLVPREHVVTLPDLPAGLREGFLEAAQRLARAVVDGLGAQGSFVAMTNVVSPSVAHLHLHVVPRTKGDGLRGFFWPRTTYGDGEASAYADRLRATLSAPDVRKS